MQKKAFSLVELSIVLVILGLLTGGILAGQSLIRAAEIRAISTEFSRYLAATQTFRDKYMALPGDMNNAVLFWNRQVNQAWCLPTSGATVTTPGTCNGDGDGIWDYAGAVSQSAEFAQFWRQLALAGLVEGDYTGLAGSGGVWHTTSAPTSKISSAYWGAVWWTSPTVSELALFNGNYGNSFIVGTQSATTEPSGVILKSEEMWGLDVKMDDGVPASGKLVPRSRVGCTLTSAGAAMTSSAADAAKLDAIYNLSNSSIVCTPVFRSLF